MENADQIITIYTDGACSGNPGPGGWGAIIVAGADEAVLCGGEPATTNNRMELLAAISALEAITEPCRIDLITDSKYVMTGITEWIINWKRKNWHGSSGKPVANVDLWQRLDHAQEKHIVKWFWVKGHAGHSMNERADILANEGMAKFKRSKTK